MTPERNRTIRSGWKPSHTSGPTQPSLIAGDGAAARIVELRNGRRVALRLARGTDISAIQAFVRGLSSRSRLNRFFAPVRELSPSQLERLTRPRSPGELVLVCETLEGAGSCIVALAQYALCEPLNAEFAVVVDDAWQRQGLGTELLRRLAEYAARAGLAASSGLVLRGNGPMLALLARLDYELIPDRDPRVIRVAKRLDANSAASA